MDALQKLAELLEQRGALPSRLSEPAVQCGLRQLAVLLHAGLHDSEDGQDGGLVRWSKQQWEYVLAVLEALVPASCDLILDSTEKEVVGHVHALAVRFSLRGLEHNVRQPQTIATSLLIEEIQHRFVQLLDMLLVEGKARERGPPAVEYLASEVPPFDVSISSSQADESVSCINSATEAGPSCSFNEAGRSASLLTLLASEQLVLEARSAGTFGRQAAVLSTEVLSILAATQKFATLKAQCVSRLLDICKIELSACVTLDSDEEDRLAQGKACLVSSILKLLVQIAGDSDFKPFDRDVTLKLVELASAVSLFLKLTRDISNTDVEDVLENDQAFSVPAILEGVLQVAENVLPDATLFLNLRTYLAASILDGLELSKGRHDVSLPGQKLPLACSSHVISYLLGMFEDVHAHTLGRYQVHARKGEASKVVNSGDDCGVVRDSLSTQLFKQIFRLDQTRSQQEHMEILFPGDTHWLDNIIAVTGLLYAQGLKVRPLIEATSSVQSDEEFMTGSVDCVTIASEDETLFGDLFLESGRNSVNSDGNTHGCSSTKKLDGLYNTPLQTTFQVLKFLRECIFHPDWHRPTYETARNQVSKEHVDFFLQILLSESNGVDKATVSGGAAHVEGSTNVIAQLHKGSFDLLYALVSRSTLPDVVQVHFSHQILRQGEISGTLSADSLVLLGNILVHRSSKRKGEPYDDPVILEVWQNFVDSVVSKGKSLRLLETSIEKAAASTPSVVHMEVLFTGFNSLSEEGRVLVFRNLLSALKSFHLCEKQNNPRNALAVSSVLISRLVLAMKYLMLQFNTFPSWLLFDMRDIIRNQPVKAVHAREDGLVASWSAHIAWRVLKDRRQDEHHLSEAFIQQLLDVGRNADPGGLLEISGVSSLQQDILDLGHCLCDVLEGWKGKAFSSVDEVLLERYIFLMAWNIRSSVGPALGSVSTQELSACTGSSPGANFVMTLGTVFHASIIQDCSLIAKDWVPFAIKVLSGIEAPPSGGKMKNLMSWDFLRQNASCHLILSSFQVGLRVLSSNNVTAREDVVGGDQAGKKSNQSGLLTFLEESASTLFCDAYFTKLLSVLSSMLGLYVNALRSCLLHVLRERYPGNKVLASLEILLKGCLSKGKQQDILETAGLSTTLIQSLLRWGSSTTWLAETMALLLGPGHDAGDCNHFTYIFFPALLHGFPSTCHPGSASVVSCMLLIEGIVDTLQCLINCHGVMHSTVKLSDFDDLRHALQAVMMDSIVENLHNKCSVLLSTRIPSESEATRMGDLYLLRHLGELLLAKAVDPGLKEAVAAQAVEVINSIRSDTARVGALQLYVSDQIPEKGGKHSTPQPVKARPTVGIFSSLVDVLAGCSNEAVNLKVMQLMIDLLTSESLAQSGFRRNLQMKFLDMNLPVLAMWLEQRLLGQVSDASGGVVARNVPFAVRDLASMFIQTLVSAESRDSDLSYRLRSHIVNGMLLILERAFLTYEVIAVKVYFSLLVQLAVGEPLLSLLLRSVLDLLGKLPIQSNNLDGLRCLLSFLHSVCTECGVRKAHIHRHSGDGEHGLSTVSNVGSGSSKAKQQMFCKSTDQNLRSAIEPASGPGDCDATSVDDDEDDGTSDGELVSLDRDDDDDAVSNERALASRVCTFTSSGSNFMEQHWYFCYTCDLTVSKGCCSVCAKVCHRGHKVVYSRLSRFFCDCGAGGVRGTSCLCLKPRKYVPPAGSCTAAASSGLLNSFVPGATENVQAPQSDSDSDLDDEEYAEKEGTFKITIVESERRKLLTLLASPDVENHVLSLCQRLASNMKLGLKVGARKDEDIVLGDMKTLIATTDLHLKRSYKSGFLDMKIKAEYPNARELKSHLVSGSIVKSLLSVSSRGRLAVGEGDKVTIFDVGQLIGQPTAVPVTVDKTTVKPLSRNAVRFEIVHLAFNSANESYLAVAGFEDCQIFTVSPRGEITDRLAVELALQDAHIRRIEWVPGSQVQLLVVTNKFVKIYDLSQDKISPTHYFTVIEDAIADATIALVGQGRLVALVLSHQGVLYSQHVGAGVDSGSRILTENIQIPEKFRPLKGVSVSYCAARRVILLSYSDGMSLIARLKSDATGIIQVSSVHDVDVDGKKKPAALHHWRETFESSGLFICLSTLKSNSAVGVHLGSAEVHAQYLRVSGGSMSLRVDGIAAYRPMTKDRNNVLLVHDDGSLQVYAYTPSDGAVNCSLSLDSHRHSSSLEPEQVKKLGAVLLGHRASSGGPPVFPLDFFEKTMCITPEVKLGGDILRNNDSESIKVSLSSEDGFLEGPTAGGFRIAVLNLNPEQVMVGCRVHVGNTSAGHIPSELRIFQRTVRLEEGVRCWYDIPFTNSEALLADEEFTLTVGPTFSGSFLPRIDNLEIYGRLKDEFGWKEKLDALLDMESQGVPGSLSGPRVRGTKHKALQTVSAPEHVFASVLRLLAGYYLADRLQSSSDRDETRLLSRKKCMPVLEVLFETDRQPLLQSAARHVLRALYPSKDAYYQAKDTMRLMGVTRACPVLASSVSAGGSATSWVVEEFSAQIRLVCKIALNRQKNLATFLEQNGLSVVDGLIQVFWEILVREQLDAQGINNLVIPVVDLIYSYAECLTMHGCRAAPAETLITPAVALLRKLLFAPYEAVRTSCSLAMSSRLLQVPFPKQTILAMDDVAESSRTTSPMDSVDGTTGSGQVMAEEDPHAASVQYCCDGCSTVPILRRRWHCNVCPDFDLCEACYEVMDGDQLPPPHTRDHPMSAIPIEMDAGGDGGEMHFSAIDELSDESLLQMATELSLQSNGSPPLNSGVEISDNSGLVHAVLDDPKRIVFSASKSAVNSLILHRLVEDMQGWMRACSGAQAVPVMQLFYRLASASSGPLVDSPAESNSLNLEKLFKLLIQEMDLTSALSAKLRSNFGEVVVLVFMFFTLVLRSWHQPSPDPVQSRAGPAGSDTATIPPVPLSSLPSSSEGQGSNDAGSQLDRACGALRQQALVSYLLGVVQQLSHHFKNSTRPSDTSSASAGTAACGSLLTIRREFASGSFTPFFSDSYAKAHRGDLFGDFHKLLLESAFRLTYSLVRPDKSDKGTEREQYMRSSGSELKLEGWQEVLCSYINNPQTTFIRKYARKLLLYMCGTKSHYYSVRDAWQLSREIKRLNKLAQKSGGFQATVSYDRSAKLVKCLCVIVDVAGARPRNWQKYCTRHSDTLQFLLNAVFSFGEESVVQTLKLLKLVFYTGKDLGPPLVKVTAPEVFEAPNSGAQNPVKSSTQAIIGKKKRKGGSDDSLPSASTSENVYLDMEAGVDQLMADDGKILQQFMDKFLLEWNASAVRNEAKLVLYGAWHHGRQPFRRLMLTLLLDRVALLPSYGQNIAEYSDLLTWLLGQETAQNTQEGAVMQGCLNGEVVKRIFSSLCTQNELLANHPNSRIYNTLSTLVEFDGYYLESEPCLACSSPEVPYTRMKLESLKSETKFTDNRILVKCVGSHTIQSVTMNVHDARRSKSVKVLNLYYNNRAVADLSELKNNWALWKRGRCCQLAFNQTELKVEFVIPITACNFMIELDSFYENLQASSLESLQCPRCSRFVTDKHGICSNCHENAYQCRQCRNINYENLDSFLCNECGYSKYGRFEFNFMAKPSFMFDSMENDEDMKKGLAAIEAESENAHRRYQQLIGFKKPLLKLVSSIGETEMDSQQKDSVQQMIVSLPGSSSFKINRKIAILGVLYGEKCKMAFDSVSKSVQTLRGLTRVLMSYLERKKMMRHATTHMAVPPRGSNRCFGCANTFVGHCLEWLQVLARQHQCRQELVGAGILRELFENNIHQGPKAARIQARAVLCALTESDPSAVIELNSLIKEKVMYCLKHHRSMDIATCVRDELQLLSETCSLTDDFWEARLRVVFQLLFRSIELGARHPVIAEHIILPCLKIVSHACTPPKPDTQPGDLITTSQPDPRHDDVLKSPPFVATSGNIKPAPGCVEKDLELESIGQDFPLMNYVEWKNGATYSDFVRRQSTFAQAVAPLVAKVRSDPKRVDHLALKCMLKWKRKACKMFVTDELAAFEESSWVHELVLSACSQAIRSEMSGLIEVLCSQSPTRTSRFLNLLMSLLPATRAAGESAAEYFDLLFKMIEPEEARLYLTVRGFLRTACSLIADEVKRIEAQEHSFHTDISQGYILHKLIELLSKFLQVPNIRARFMKEELLAQALEALLAIRGLIVQKTKLTSDCGRLLRELLDSLLQESSENKRHFIRACISGLQIHRHDQRDRTSLFILEQLCNIVCPSKPEPAYMMVLNKSHTQEEFIRGSMTKNPYSSLEVGPLMRDVKNKICHQLELVGLLEDDYGMELLVSGNIIALDLSVAQVYEHVWRKAHIQAGSSAIGSSLLAAVGGQAPRECPPMAITYRLQGLDGEATEPMIKELEDDREESQDPEVEFAIAGVMRECGGLDVILSMVQQLSNDGIKPGQEEFAAVLKLLMYCCKIRANRQALLGIGALNVLLETARRAFSTDASEPAEGLLLIVESLVTEANESDVGVMENTLIFSRSQGGTDGQAASAVLMFLERLSHPATTNKSNKQHRNHDTVARILPFLAYGDQSAMEVLVKHFMPYLKDWGAFDKLQTQRRENMKDESLGHHVAEHQLALENFVRVTESIKLNPSGEKLKSLIMEKGIIKVAIKYLKDAFPPIGRRSDFKATPEWARGLEMPSIPIILLMLRGLSKGHKLIQRCLDEEGVLPLLHALEGVSGENEIGARAENLLDTVADKDGSGGGFLSEKVAKLRHATRDDMRQRALRKREELLQGLGMRRELRSDGGERIVVSKPSIEGLEDIEEEEAGLACMVCREGYRLRPTDMLGAYCYSKRVNLAHGIGGPSKAEWVYTTVSHFNVIHFQCHQEAKRADASLKNPKREWEGATLRNNETLCNNLFPLRGPAVPLAQYARCVDQHWDNLNALGRADGSRLRLLIYDIVLMLGRFATGASFSIDCKGGGRESNSRLVPFMIQMARHLLDQGGASQRRIQAKALASYISPTLSTSPEGTGETLASFKPSTPPTPPASRAGAGTGSSDETVQVMMVQSLLLQSLDDWLQHRRTFLQRGIVHAYVQHKQGRSVLPQASPSPSAFHAPSPLRTPPPIPGSEAGVRTATVVPSPEVATPSSSTAEAAVSRQCVSGSEEPRGEEARNTICGNVVSKAQLFRLLHPMLVYIGLVDRMQHYFKKGPVGPKSGGRSSDQPEQSREVERRGSSTTVASEGSSAGDSMASGVSTGHFGIEPWEAIMKEKLRDVTSMLGLAKDLLEWLEEMQNVEDLQEALDVMGTLGDAFAGGCTSCDDFVCDAINASSNVPGGPITIR